MAVGVTCFCLQTNVGEDNSLTWNVPTARHWDYENELNQVNQSIAVKLVA